MIEMTTRKAINKRSIIKNLFVVIITSALAGPIFANPVLDNVASGNVQVQQSPGSTVVQQNSQQAILNWHSFNIDAGESTHFQQPAGGVALNRISPNQGASQIYGNLSATGKIILVNQAGIFFGPSARVDVGGIIASTSDISDKNFLAGKYSFDQPGSGYVVNRGTITAAEHGLVALIGNNVSNEGVISAHGGYVVLASGRKFSVNLSGDGLVNFTVDEASTSTSIGPDGKPMKNGVNNSGMIYANGGTILMSAKAASNVLDHVINMEGVAQARSVKEANGEIILSGDEGTVRVAGNMDVSGSGAGQKGGSIKIASKHIVIDKSAQLNASGDVGGGTILIGGDSRGTTPIVIFNGQQVLANAAYTQILSGAQINADALTSGNGGKIVAWGNNATQVYGTLSAQGGALSGNGGSIETSGAYLDVNGISVNTSAPHGTFGTWLLDPTNIYIADNQTNATNAGMSGTDTSVDGSGPATFIASGAVNDSLLLVSTLQTALGSNDVLVSTTNGAGGGAGNINLVDPITWSSAQTLTLSADNNIAINAGITATNGGLTLSAVNAANSITTSASGTINVANFILQQGQWSQTGSLPSFTASNDFELAAGTQFLRATGGNGSSGNPYQITDIYGLQGMGTLLSSSFNLANNVDASGTSTWNSGAGFVSIGDSGTPFTGNFNGLNHTISNLVVNSSAADVGFFGFVGGAGYTGIIQNLTLSNPTITSNANDSNVGALVGAIQGQSSGTNILNAITVSGGSVFAPNGTNFNTKMGGIIGQLDTGTVTNLSNSASVTSPSLAKVGGVIGTAIGSGAISATNSGTIQSNMAGNVITLVGGVVGTVEGTTYTISNSSNTGAVTAGGSSQIGGIIGTINSGSVTITDSFNTGAISTTNVGAADGIGGIVGVVFDADLTINASYNLGSITTTDVATGAALTGIGGILGNYQGSGITLNFGTNTSTAGVYNAGAITVNHVGANTRTVYAGGLLGATSDSSTVNINNSNNLGIVTGANSNSVVGGLIGGLTSDTTAINNSFSAGYLNAATSGNLGAIVGLKTSSTGSVTATNVYWDSSTTGTSNAIGTNTTDPLSGTATNNTTAQLQAGLPSGFSSSLWGIISGKSYPYLKAIFTSTPRVVSGTTNSSAGTNVTLADNGFLLSGSLAQRITSVGNNGYYYFLEGGSVIASGDDLLVYAANTGGNAVTVAPSSTGSVTNLNLTSNTLTVGTSNGSASIANISNSDLSTALGSLSGGGILYSASGANIQTSGVPLNITSDVSSYNVNGNLSSAGITFTNTLAVSNGATISGTINGNGSNATLNYQSYGSPVRFSFSGNGVGNVLNNSSAVIGSFNQIASFIGSTNSSIVTNPNKANTVTLTSFKNGQINDPVYFSNISQILGSGNTTIIFPNGTLINFSSPSSATWSVNGVDMTFTDISQFVNFTASVDTQANQNVVTAVTPSTTTNSTNNTSPQQNSTNTSQVFSATATTLQSLTQAVQNQNQTELQSTQYSTAGACGR